MIFILELDLNVIRKNRLCSLMNKHVHAFHKYTGNFDEGIVLDYEDNQILVKFLVTPPGYLFHSDWVDSSGIREL